MEDVSEQGEGQWAVPQHPKAIGKNAGGLVDSENDCCMVHDSSALQEDWEGPAVTF